MSSIITLTYCSKWNHLIGRTLYNEHKIRDETLSDNIQTLWSRNLPVLIPKFEGLDQDYITKQIPEQAYPPVTLSVSLTPR
jgi:hypothetical protein